MKKQLVTITQVAGDGVSYITQAGKEWSLGNAGGDPFPNVKVGQKWEMLIDDSGQYPTGKVISATLQAP